MFETYYGPPEYARLAEVLKGAFDQAASGKGKERHACEDHFEDQIMCYLAKQVGIAGPVFQVCKKAVEACRLPPEAAIAELKGAINYAAGAIIELEDQINRIPEFTEAEIINDLSLEGVN